MVGVVDWFGLPVDMDEYPRPVFRVLEDDEPIDCVARGWAPEP